MNELMTVQDVADYMRCSKSNVYQLVQQGKLPYCRPGGKKVLFLIEDIQQWVTGSRKAADHV